MSGVNNDQHVPQPTPPPPSPPELNFTLPQVVSASKHWSSDEIQSQLPTEILQITANDHEFIACYSYMKNIKRSWHDAVGMVDFGQFDGIGGQNVRVALMKCGQGPTEALSAVKAAAEILYPKVVLFVGICASMKPTKAKLGDVVISAKLETYADKKDRGDGTVEYRGIKVNVSRKMAQRILSAEDGWKRPLKDQSSLNVDVHRDAVMLSGPELVNNLERRQKLSDNFRDALGLEMEGEGLCKAAYDLDIEWAVVKAVSDFADGSKTDEWQPFASVMAASLVHNMFKQAHVIESWRHYKNIDSRMTGGVDTTDGREPEQESNSNIPQSHSRMCAQCRAADKIQLSDNRSQWDIREIEDGALRKICELLDLDERSKEPLLSALECFTGSETDIMKKTFEAKGGIGISRHALLKWDAKNDRNNVGALKKIVEETMTRVDVLREIEKWEKLFVCHGCGIKLKIPKSDN